MGRSDGAPTTNKEIDMKKTTTKKLRLGTETLRDLTKSLSQVRGGLPTNTIIMDGCAGPPAPNSNTGGCKVG
jgi:hypothetical protein